MVTNTSIHNIPYEGNRGFGNATPALLMLRLLQYQRLAADPATPPALRAYSVALVREIRDEISRRAPSLEAA